MDTLLTPPDCLHSCMAGGACTMKRKLRGARCSLLEAKLRGTDAGIESIT